MGRTATPLPDRTVGVDIVDRLPDRDPLVIEAVPGAVAVAGLAAQLVGCGRRPLWARLAPFELDPPALSTLARAVFDSGVGAGRVGPAASRAVTVVESPDTARAHAFLDRAAPVLDGAFGPGRTGSVVLHLISGDGGEDGDPTPGPPADPDLADTQAGAHLITLLTGRPGLLCSIDRVEALIGRSAVGDTVAGCASADDLTRALARALLEGEHPEYRRRLRMAAILGFAHERLTVIAPVLAQAVAHPWWIPLENGWYQIDGAWRSALAAPEEGGLPVATVARVVGELVDQAAPEEALEFCLDAGCPGLASDLLAGTASDLLAAGRPRALRRWLSRLPPHEHARHAALLARIGPVPTPQHLRTASAPPRAAHPRRWRLRRQHPSGPPIRLPQPVSVDARDLRPSPEPPPVLSVRLLGAVEVAVDGRAVEHWHGTVGRAALAYVLLRRRRVSPDELAGALWPDVPAATARNRMHVALHRLRADLAAIDPRPVLVNAQGYMMDPLLRLDLDTDRFERHAARGDDALREVNPQEALDALLAAIDCYGGELLAGERDEEWVVLAREHYRVRLLDVLGKAAQLALDIARPALAVELGHRLLAVDFCREDLHRLLICAYARLGQPQLALRQYQICVRQLRVEFGLDPAPATVELADRVRRQEPV